MIADEGQYGQGDGPCLQALRADRPVSMTIEQVVDQWPILAAASEAGVRALHAEPLHARQHAVGCLNMYSATSGCLQDPDPDLLVVLTEYLDRGLNGLFRRPARRTGRQPTSGNPANPVHHQPGDRRADGHPRHHRRPGRHQLPAGARRNPGHRPGTGCTGRINENTSTPNSADSTTKPD
jgi:hypothetical protein